MVARAPFDLGRRSSLASGHYYLDYLFHTSLLHSYDILIPYIPLLLPRPLPHAHRLVMLLVPHGHSINLGMLCLSVTLSTITIIL